MQINNEHWDDKVQSSARSQQVNQYDSVFGMGREMGVAAMISVQELAIGSYSRSGGYV